MTTILDAIAKPALVGWAARETATYAIDNLPALAQLDRQAAIDLAKGAAWRKRDAAGERGTDVHEHIAALVTGKPVPATAPEQAPYLAGFSAFVAAHRPRWLMSEVTVYSPRLRYAGTFDLLAVLAGQEWLLDVKTGKGVYPEVACQLAAYRAAEFALTDSGPAPIDYGHARMADVHLRPDGTFGLIEVDDADGGALAAFTAAAAVSRFLATGERRLTSSR